MNNDELYHWKYIKRIKTPKGTYRYIYKDDELNKERTKAATKYMLNKKILSERSRQLDNAEDTFYRSLKDRTNKVAIDKAAENYKKANHEYADTSLAQFFAGRRYQNLTDEYNKSTGKKVADTLNTLADKQSKATEKFSKAISDLSKQTISSIEKLADKGKAAATLTNTYEAKPTDIKKGILKTNMPKKVIDEYKPIQQKKLKYTDFKKVIAEDKAIQQKAETQAYENMKDQARKQQAVKRTTDQKAKAEAKAKADAEAKARQERVEATKSVIEAQLAKYNAEKEAKEQAKAKAKQQLDNNIKYVTEEYKRQQQQSDKAINDFTAPMKEATNTAKKEISKAVAPVTKSVSDAYKNTENKFKETGKAMQDRHKANQEAIRKANQEAAEKRKETAETAVKELNKAISSVTKPVSDAYKKLDEFDKKYAQPIVDRFVDDYAKATEISNTMMEKKKAQDEAKKRAQEEADRLRRERLEKLFK